MLERCDRTTVQLNINVQKPKISIAVNPDGIKELNVLHATVFIKLLVSIFIYLYITASQN